MGCTPSKEGSATAQEPGASKSVDVKMASNVKEGAADKSGASALASANIIFVLGGPGSGKGTQCDKILKTCDSNFVLDLQHGVCTTTLVRSRSRTVQTKVLRPATSHRTAQTSRVFWLHGVT